MTRISVVLLPAVAAFLLAAGSVAAQTSEKSLTVEAIYAHGPLIGHPPDELTWSPDGKHLTYLEGGQLMEVDSATGRTHVLVSAAKMAPRTLNSGVLLPRRGTHMALSRGSVMKNHPSELG